MTTPGAALDLDGASCRFGSAAGIEGLSMSIPVGLVGRPEATTNAAALAGLTALYGLLGWASFRRSVERT
jgi:hypothetical protein